MPPSKKPIVGIDLGGTNMQIGVVADGSKILSRSKRKTRADEGRDAVIGRMVEAITEACTEAKLKVSDLAAIGIGAPGVIEPGSGLVVEAVNLRWNEVPLAQIITKKTGLPAFIDNDVRCAIYGENKLGAGDNSKDLLGVWLGTGIGGGLILNGTLYHGGFSSAGEIGHTIIFPGHPLGTRTLENFCSRTAVVDRLVRLIRSNHASALTELTGGDLSDVRSKLIGRAYQMNDPLTVEVVHEAADLLGTVISSTVTLLSLPRVVLGGGLTEALGDPFVEQVKKAVRAHVFPEKAKAVKVVGTKLCDDAGVFGSALLAAERL